ncbi:MAG: response regulator [Lachnospiraceae bacterium]|nr:response regulator [Lachnospiraceae bacterium]
MYTKTIFALIDCLAIIDILITYRASKLIKERYGWLLRRSILFAVPAITANIFIAFAGSALFAGIAYCVYFASVDWILYYLTGFALNYTDHEDKLQRFKPTAKALMILDSVSIMLNPLLHHHFDVYEHVTAGGDVFYQTSFHGAYYIHLGIDYIAIALTVIYIVYRVTSSYSFYRLKYIMILSVFLFVVLLNLVYMAFSLVLDASVVFYAVAATLIYFSITRFVPQKFMSTSIGMAVDDMNEGLVLFDINDTCIFANEFSKSRFSLEEQDFTFQAEPMLTVRSSLAENGESYGKTTYIRRRKAGGEVREEHYQIRFNQLKDGKGRRIGSYLLIEDITEETFFLKQLDDARNEADQANKAKSLFLANMSHEIRTPLNAVLGMNELILRTTTDPEITAYANNILASGTTLLRLISDVLDFSKIEANKMDIIKVQYEPHAMLRELFSRFERMADEKDLYLDISCDPAMPVALMGDEQHLIQILTNILSNAVKYTKNGGVTLSVTFSGIDPTRIRVRYEIADTGMGIAQEDIPRLFDTFQRINEKENATIQGTGLGLAITKQLVDLMGGEISVTSTLGRGSTFVVSIPQDVIDFTPEGLFRKTAHTKKEAYTESFHAPDARVLIVDDLDINIVLLSGLLRKTGIKMEKAGSGDAAIEKCRNRKYDLILLDHRMPEKDGIETFEEIRASGMNTDTPVIMLTANALSGAREEYERLGFADYLTKPVDSAALERALIRLLPADKVEITKQTEDAL